jgi:hypothetical protein
VVNGYLRTPESKFFPALGTIVGPLEAMAAERRRQQQIQAETAERRELIRHRDAGEFGPMPPEQAEKFKAMVEAKSLKFRDHKAQVTVRRRRTSEETKQITDGIEFVLQLRARAREEGWVEPGVYLVKDGRMTG